MVPSGTCSSCKFWLRVAEMGESAGLCRRYPPSSSAVMMPVQANVLSKQMSLAPQTISSFPSMSGDGWCGEFQLPLSLLS